MPGFFDPMVGDPVLGKVVSADFFAAHTLTDSIAAQVAELVGSLGFLFFPEFGTEEFQGDFAVLFLKAFGLTGNDNASRLVGQTGGSRNFLNILAAMTGGMIELPLQINGIDDDFFRSNNR